MSDDDGLICAYLLDGGGGGREIGWDDVRSWHPGAAPLWVHLDRSNFESGRWLREQFGLDALICEALLAEETRPRSVSAGDGLLVILRGVNLHPEADPAPQRDALSRLLTEEAPWLTPLYRARLREIADRVTRYVEDLDSGRDRASVTQEELAGRLAEQMNKTMYVLSLVAAVFLPLGLITGLLGINVGGIPGTNFKWAFTGVSVFLVVIAVVQIAVFRRMKWL